MASARIALTVQFESAHFLPRVPEGHRCRRLHGHTFRCDVELWGEIRAQEGWVQDFGVIEERVQSVISRLDHRLLNEVEGLENPTSEHVALYIWQALRPLLPDLYSVSIWENPRMRAQVTRDDLE